MHSLNNPASQMLSIIQLHDLGLNNRKFVAANSSDGIRFAHYSFQALGNFL